MYYEDVRKESLRRESVWQLLYFLGQLDIRGGGDEQMRAWVISKSFMAEHFGSRAW